MRYHPVQANQEALKKMSEAFQARMLENKVLPVNPFKAKKAERWLARMGARMKPGSFRFDPYKGVCETGKYVNFLVYCKASKVRIKNMRTIWFMRVEIPHDLADKILTLGYLP